MLQQLKTFRQGGIHPPEMKLAQNTPISYLKLPKQLILPVNQHIGKPAKTIVKKGEEVERGQPLTEGGGFVSSVVHAPVKGVIQKITRFPLLGGQFGQAIVLSVAQAGEDFKLIREREIWQKVDLDKLTAEEIRQTIADAGIVGMGGAGFPTHVKLSPPPEKQITAFIVNGAECEPYITSDHRLMLEWGAELLQGVRIVQKLFSYIPVYIGIEENKTDAIAILSNLSSRYKGIQVVPLKTKYPQGGEKQLIKAILKREVPAGGLPMDVGVIVQNVATMVAIYDAFYFNRPLTERVVTVSGELVANPVNILAPVGTPVSCLLETLQIDLQAVRLFIAGGPMMGKTSFSFESPVTKTTSALLFFSEKTVVWRRGNPCIRCGQCLDVCPMGLPVTLLTASVKAGQVSEIVKENILDCIECGSCSYICPAERSLVHWMRLGKSMLRRDN